MSSGTCTSSAPTQRKHGLGRGPNNIPDPPTNPDDRILIRIRPPPNNTEFGDHKVVKCIAQLCLKGWPTPEITWVETPDTHKNLVWEEFQKLYKWDPADHATVSALFWQKCKERTKDNLNKERNKALHNASMDHPHEGEQHIKDKNPWWYSKLVWEGMCDKWCSDQWKKKQTIASRNIISGAPEGARAPPTWRGGSISQLQHIVTQEDQYQGQPIDWLEVYVATRENLPDAIRIAENYKRLMDAKYPKGSERPSIDQELCERASVVKKNYVKGQGQKRRHSYSGTCSSTSYSSQSSQSSAYPPPHTPIDCVRAICRDRRLLVELSKHLSSLTPEDLAAVVADAAADPEPSQN